MKHKSIKLDSPIEFINVTPVNPLISKCQIKVCYVGDEPNRNKSIITKEFAKELANSIPGCPIVGFYNESKEDFEEHNRIIDISNGTIKIKDTTIPYGFVDMNAKVWFQKFIDDETTEHEYLMTEGYLWTGQYPESQRIIDKGNNQSMELDEKTINATWTKDDNGKPQFFIINEAIMSKLCILGEDAEPCFEGSQITKVQFSFDDGFEERLSTMFAELTKVLNEGGTKLFNRYAVEIGDGLWESLHRYLLANHADPDDSWCSIYCVEGIYEEGTQKFAILRNRQNSKYYRLNFSLSEKDGFVPAAEFTEVEKTYVPVEETPQFDQEAVKAYELEFKKQEEEKQENEEEKPADDGEEEKPADDGEEEKPSNDEEEEDEKKKKTFSLEEYSALESTINELQEKINKLEDENNSLIEFKAQVEREKKEEMINSFYMLSDEDKKDVLENIDKYSLDDIEAKLSIICVRNKVNFNLEEPEDNQEPSGPVVFDLDNNEPDEATPAWVKAALDVAKNME